MTKQQGTVSTVPFAMAGGHIYNSMNLNTVRPCSSNKRLMVISNFLLSCMFPLINETITFS